MSQAERIVRVEKYLETVSGFLLRFKNFVDCPRGKAVARSRPAVHVLNDRFAYNGLVHNLPALLMELMRVMLAIVLVNCRTGRTGNYRLQINGDLPLVISRG